MLKNINYFYLSEIAIFSSPLIKSTQSSSAGAQNQLFIVTDYTPVLPDSGVPPFRSNLAKNKV
jgi:hypothetical protein